MDSAPPTTEGHDVNDSESDDINYDLKNSALRVIEDIENKQIFDDIRIDFDSIVDSIAPEEDPAKLNQMLVSYYEEIHEVLQKRLYECQDIIEEYMTQLIESKKKCLQQHMDSIMSGNDENSQEYNHTFKNGKIDISSITSEHNMRLTQLREQYEEFLKEAEADFFNVLKSVKGSSDGYEYDTEDHKVSNL